MNQIYAGRRVLVIDDETDTLDACSQILGKDGYVIDTANDAVKALGMIRSKYYDVLLTDIKMPGMSGIELLKEVKKIHPEVAVIMITGYASVDTAIESMKEGAYHYIPKPFTPDEIRVVIRKAIEQQELLRENRELREKLKKEYEEFEIIGQSNEIANIRHLTETVAKTDSTVLVTGETGTGKELVAREIHMKSKRSHNPMVTVNCAAIPSDLLESELFGFEKGAFTGALRKKKGSFELAHDTTLFLDEIGDMKPDLQAKLMRALQEGEIKPIGSERTIRVDTRIISATNKNIEQAMGEGRFREDLYYRLNVMRIHVPALRERKSDIPILAQHFLKKYNRHLNRRIETFSKEALDMLSNYDWPGNVRELENAIERAVILEEGNEIGAHHFKQLVNIDIPKARKPKLPTGDLDLGELPPLDQVEKDYIMQVLQATKWNKKRASEILGISTVTIWRKVEQAGEDSKK